MKISEICAIPVDGDLLTRYEQIDAIFAQISAAGHCKIERIGQVARITYPNGMQAAVSLRLEAA